MASNLAQKVSGNTKVAITDINSVINGVRTLSLCNIHAADTVTVDLYIASQVTADVTSTTVVAAETEAASTSSVTLTVKTVDATADALLDERIYKSDGTLFGTCTAVSSTTEIVFSGGLDNAITNNNVLFTGTRYYVLKSYVLPANATLVLERDELRFDSSIYKMYIKLSAADSTVDIITRK